MKRKISKIITSQAKIIKRNFIKINILSFIKYYIYYIYYFDYYNFQLFIIFNIFAIMKILNQIDFKFLLKEILLNLNFKSFIKKIKKIYKILNKINI